MNCPGNQFKKKTPQGGPSGDLGQKFKSREGGREGTRPNPGNQLVCYITCIHSHWTMPQQVVIYTQQHKLSH